jgi:hypothetical protein
VDEWTVRVARAAVDHVCGELATIMAQVPAIRTLDWRSEAQRRFHDRMDDVAGDLRRAAAALERADEEFAAALSAMAASPEPSAAVRPVPPWRATSHGWG